MVKEKEKFSVIVPVYRSEKTLPTLVSRLEAVFEALGADYEIVLVDDASPDDSWKVMEQLRVKNPRIKLIQHMRNFGQHKALLCGMLHCNGDLVITMDDDLQHPPEEVANLVDAIRDDDEADVVIGAYNVKNHSWFRNMGTRVINGITSYVFGKDAGLQLTSFRIMRRPVVEELTNARCHNPRVGQLLLLITNRIKNVPVEHQPRAYGRSGYSFRRLVSDALDNILSNSSLPLQVVSYLGFGSSLLSFVLSVYYLAKYLVGGIGVAGWTTTILLLLFFFGILLFAFGVVGEYLIRILREVQGTPRSVVRRKDP